MIINCNCCVFQPGDFFSALKNEDVESCKQVEYCFWKVSLQPIENIKVEKRNILVVTFLTYSLLILIRLATFYMQMHIMYLLHQNAISRQLDSTTITHSVGLILKVVDKMKCQLTKCHSLAAAEVSCLFTPAVVHTCSSRTSSS